MKVLVTGGNGQLGTEIRKCFERGYTELGVPNVLKQENTVHTIDVRELDITVLEDVFELFKQERYDAVINCAAYTNVNKCETEIDLAYKVNAIGARNVAIACEKINAKLIHISTDYVFSGDTRKPYIESDVCCPQSVYGSSKYLGECYVRDFCTRYFIVRTSWLYGYHGKNFVKSIMSQGLKKGAVTVVADQRGNPTNAADLAHHIIKLIDTDEYGVYHATGHGECSWFEFANAIIATSGINAVVSPCTSDQFYSPAKRPAFSSLDNLMFRITVGDEFRDWQTALKCFMHNYKGE